MLLKFGINSTREEKNGPTVGEAISSKNANVHQKVIVCECGAKLRKSCENAMVCEISVMKCPKCGRNVK